MMFPKPEKKIKEKKPYNSLQRKKAKKELPEWKQDLFAHHQSKPSTKDRGDFPRKIIQELIAEAGGKCQSCHVNPDTTTHHVMPRAPGRGGRGVKTNGLRLCGTCHDRVQTNEGELQYWISVYREKYGNYFWFDQQDWEKYEQRQKAERQAEQEQRERMEQLQPIIDLLSAAAGRKLKTKEIRIIDDMDHSKLAIFVNLMRDVVTGQIEDKANFGYGFFDD